MMASSRLEQSEKSGTLASISVMSSFANRRPPRAAAVTAWSEQARILSRSEHGAKDGRRSRMSR
jgi:hypothetical protein